MLPTSSTGAAIREPSGAAVQTNVPGLMSVTGTLPPGVAIRVDGLADLVENFELELVHAQRRAGRSARGRAARRDADYQKKGGPMLDHHLEDAVSLGQVTVRGTKRTLRAY